MRESLCSRITTAITSCRNVNSSAVGIPVATASTSVNSVAEVKAVINNAAAISSEVIDPNERWAGWTYMGLTDSEKIQMRREVDEFNAQSR